MGSAEEAANDGFTADFQRVPVVNLHKGNWDKAGLQLRQDISSCDFIAVDCELSGLGDRKKLNASAIDER